MMRGMRLTPSAAEVARQYADFVGVFVLDQIDSKESPCVDALDMRPVVTNTVMSGLRERRALARQVVRALEIET
jgi:LPPG:FO 2-phospho-L-lactate transferase